MRIPHIAALALAAAAWPTICAAAPVSIQVSGADGRPLAGAVVTLAVPGAPPAEPHGSYVMAQHDIAFEPRILIVPVGASVSFPNRDQVRHHVYSFSPAKKFELKLYGFDVTKSVVFDKAGVAALGCNIHDTMTGFVYVTASAYAAISDASGRVSFSGVPAGRATLTLWHPSIRAPGNTMSQTAAIPTAGLATSMAAGR